MIADDAIQAARELLLGRRRALGALIEHVELQHGDKDMNQLLNILQQSARVDRPALGLMVSEAALDSAVHKNSRKAFFSAIYRFGAHLNHCASDPSLGNIEKLGLLTATEMLYAALPTVVDSRRAQVAFARDVLRQVVDLEPRYVEILGIEKHEFSDLLQRCIVKSPESGQSDSVPLSPLGFAKSTLDMNKRASSTQYTPLPTWLTIDYSSNTDPLVMSTANWIRHDNQASNSAPDLNVTWQLFCEHRYVESDRHLSRLYDTLGTEWGPTSGADAMRTWHWVRAVRELASIERGEVLDERRSWTSACEYAAKCVPKEFVTIGTFASQALNDFASEDLASIRAWCAYTSRLVTLLGHEDALFGYSNLEKAQLRQAWSAQFGLSPDESRTTAVAALTISSRLKNAVRAFYVGARDGSKTSRTIRELNHQFVPFLDEAESGLFSDFAAITEDVERVVEDDSANHQDLVEVDRALQDLLNVIATSGSGLLLDCVAPHIKKLMGESVKAAQRLGDISRPFVEVGLLAAKVPFSGAAGSDLPIRFRLRNVGNAAAENIVLDVSASQVKLNGRCTLDYLAPGAESEATVVVTAIGSSPTVVTLSCSATWSDMYLQQFYNTQQLAAEDQKPVSWTAADVNPFSLGTISDPKRLIGRADDLTSLDALLAGRASAYITGHKRVGKTSLTRVLIKSVGSARGWAGSLLPLGRALGQDQSSADLVYALLDEIYSAASQAYWPSLKHIDEIGLDTAGNFARAANRWLRSLAGALPEDARVVIAIDDFDELPPHLITGQQADALFLFLRSLVDEPWLNLIVVGSEVLPSIIQAQAHKLNQIVPVSVNNFASRDATAELLTTPTLDRLEWTAEAIDRVHYLCAGSPYYETLLAQRLWQAMRERSRSIVTLTDVVEAAADVAREAPDSHFIHLWADSSTGLNHTARPAVMASAVLRSIARCGGPDLLPADSEEVVRVASAWIQSATANEWNDSIAALRGRSVIERGPADTSLLVTIPLVGTWLNHAGSRVLDTLYTTSKHATATKRMITDSDLVALSRKLMYHGEHVSEIRIKAWLNQFGDNYHQYLAYKMLRRMVTDGYFTSTKLQNTVLPRLLANVSKLASHRVLVREANNHNLKNAYLIQHGVAGDSTQGSLSVLSKALKIKKANVVDFEVALMRVKASAVNSVLFLLDDFCGSGSHLSKLVREFTGLSESLDDEILERISLVVGANVVTDLNRITETQSGVQYERVAGVVLGDRLRAFHNESGIFETSKELNDAEDMVTSIGKALLSSNPLGFGGDALLALFESNCPNNAPPIFWRSGIVSGVPWVPLFERSF